MDMREFVVKLLDKGVDHLFKAAKKVPEDRLDWGPSDKGRSALDQLQECAYMPSIYCQMFADRKPPEFTQEFMEAYERGRKEFTSLAACEEACRKGTAEMAALLRGMSEEEICSTIFLPFWGGADYTLAEIAMLHYWNLSYHEGQIYYISTLV